MKSLLKWTTLALLIVLMSTVLVMAGATFGPNTSTQPTWLNPGYQWMVEVDAISNPDKLVCLDYSIAPSGVSDQVPCTCDDTIDAGDDCAVGTGHWTCTIPDDYPNETITWSTGTWSAGGGNSCGAEKSVASTGDTPTSPTAVTLSNVSASTDSSIAVIGLFAGFMVVALAGLGLRYSRKN